MARAQHVLAAAVGSLVLSSPAHGSIAFVGCSQVPITITALNIDPVLTGYTCYDLLVSISPGDHFAAAGLVGALPAGQFYVPFSFNADTGVQPIAAFIPYLAYDTFVSRPGYVDPGDDAIVGSQSGAAMATMPGSPNSNRFNTTNEIDVAWEVLATANTLSGIQPIARLTISYAAFGGVSGPAFLPPTDPSDSQFTGVLKDPNSTVSFGFGLVPEPTSLSLMGLGVAAMTLRRRRQACKS